MKRQARLSSRRSSSRWLFIWAIVAPAVVIGSSCTNTPTRAQREAAAQKCTAELRSGEFEKAETEAKAALAVDQDNPKAHLVMAFARYHEAAHELRDFFAKEKFQSDDHRTFHHEATRALLENTEAGLSTVEAHLASASRDEELTLDLSLASWERDWNHNGRIDESDRLLFQIEYDADGARIPKSDPRRKPTFRFDIGDVYWARAMIAFQRAALDVILAYKWTELDKLTSSGHNPPDRVTLRIHDRAKVLAARDLILTGLDHASRCREEYLAETDDHGEWVPNPRQKNHPMPLPVDEALYETWAGVITDVRGMLKGESGISVAEVAQLGDRTWKTPPGGYIDLERLFTDPGDIVLDLMHMMAVFSYDEEERSKAVKTVLRDIFGDKYVEEMKPTPLVKRLSRMKGEMERGEESFERKLRYLFWLN